MTNSRTVVEKNTDNLNVLLSTLKHAGGGRFCPLSADMACIPSTIIKTSQMFFFGESGLMSLLPKFFLGS